MGQLNMFTLTNIVVILFITTVINFSGAYIGWQRKKARSGTYFAFGMLAVTLWTLSAGLDYASVTIPYKVFFAKLEYAGYNAAFFFFALTTLSYAGFDSWLEKTPVKFFLGMIPVSNILLAWTNEWHGWLWTGFRRSEFGANTVIFEHGPGYLWAAVTGYLMILIIIVPLWHASRRGPAFSRRQARLLFLSSLFPIIANLLYLFQPPEFKGVDWSSITFSVSGLLFLTALYGTRFLDLVPVARDKLVASLSDGMIVLDMQNRIIDINQAAATMIGSMPEKIIGKELDEVLPRTLPLQEQAPEQEIRTELEISWAEKRYFDVLISPLQDERKKVIGRLIIFRDITERKENEIRLLQLTRAVEQSPTSIVITDTAGKITYVNPLFSELTGYTYEEAVGKNPNILKSNQTPDNVYRELWQNILFGQTWQGEFLNKKKNGELYWENAIIAPVLGSSGEILNFIAVKQDITERKKSEQELERSFLEIQELHKHLKETQAQLVEQQRTLAVLDERQRLARALHDSVNQSIHGMVLFADTLAATLERNNIKRAREIMDRLRESAKQSLKETRLMLYELQGPDSARSVDLIQDLETRLAMVESRGGVRAQLIQEGSLENCPPEWHEDLFWIAVEALNNALKHAQANSVQVWVRGCPEFVEMEIRDNGRGFDPQKVESGGLGLKNLHQRAAIIGGTLTIESAPSKGTTVRFCAEIKAGRT